MSGRDWTNLLAGMPVVSSHSHHGRPEQHAGLTLDRLLQSSYAGWCGIPVGRSAEEHESYIESLGANTYFIWLSKAIAELYECGEITVDNWDAISARITQAHDDPEHHFRLLSGPCKMRFLVQDSYWHAGSDLGRPELFHPTYRVNHWVMGHSPGVADHNGNSPWQAHDFHPASFEEYLALMEATLQRAVQDGAVALKSAVAYDRTLCFDNPDFDAARRAFRASGDVSEADKLAFGDVVTHRVCEIAARLRVPLQVHLGLGLIHGSRPMLFEPTIRAHPGTTFDLFHGGYPWTGEVAGLLHHYDNVICDVCWLPLISTTAAVSALHEFLDVTRSSDRIVWGDDAWTAEEAFGARRAWEFVLGRVLSERVRDGLCSTRWAERLAEKLMFENGKKLFSR